MSPRRFELRSGIRSGLMPDAPVIKSITTDWTYENEYDLVLIDTTGGVVTVTMPDPAINTEVLATFKRISAGANNAVIDGNGNDVEFSATQSLTTQGAWLTLQTDGSEWLVVG